MVLGFRTQWGKPPPPTQFEAKILDGRKKHTLREDPKDRWKAGNQIHYVVGNRTKARRQFRQSFCTGTQTITLSRNVHDQLFVSVLGRDKAMSKQEVEQFALNDGFDSWTDFEQWFVNYLKAKGERWINLKLIHWTDLRY